MKYVIGQTVWVVSSTYRNIRKATVTKIQTNGYYVLTFQGLYDESWLFATPSEAAEVCKVALKNRSIKRSCVMDGLKGQQYIDDLAIIRMENIGRIAE